MTDIGSSTEMVDLMAELEGLLQRHTLMIVKLQALTSLRNDAIATVEDLIRREVEIINRVHVEGWTTKNGFPKPTKFAEPKPASPNERSRLHKKAPATASG